jgi:teichuronic acid biosynthesis glycosyltransferase TuaC
MSEVAKMRICVISHLFPKPKRPEYGAFVANLVAAFGSLGHEVSVVAPTRWQDIGLGGRERFEKFDLAHGRARVLRPAYLSLSRFGIGKLRTDRLARYWMLSASKKYLSAVRDADFYYGKFFGSGGRIAEHFGKLTGKPAFLDLGESNLGGQILDTKEDVSRYLHRFTGVVCVSEGLANLVMSFGVDRGRILVAPNAVDKKIFKPLPRHECRERLGIGAEEFVVVSVGHFIKRKGTHETLAALDGLKGVSAFFIGHGPVLPQGDNVVFRGRVENRDLPLFLSAADVFVLPTHAEGRCNAIEEALACGLPVISSAIPSVKEQVDPGSSILVNVGDVQGLRGAIRKLQMDRTLRDKMAAQSLRISEARSLEGRASTILDWIGHRTGNDM